MLGNEQPVTNYAESSIRSKETVRCVKKMVYLRKILKMKLILVEKRYTEFDGANITANFS